MVVSTTVVPTRSRSPRTTRRQAHEPLDQPLEDGRPQAVAEPDERVGVGDPLPVDASERAVHQTAADRPLALVEGPVEQVVSSRSAGFTG
jgi:hypothetical protein